MLSKYNLVLFFFFILNVYLFYDLNGHWSHYVDSEIIWPYNSLLILSGYKVEFIEFGSIYYILLSIYQYFLNFFNISNIQNLDTILNSNDFSQIMQELIFFTRLFTAFLGFIFLIILKKIFYKIIKNDGIALILSILLFYSPGFIIAMSHSRADFVSVLFLILFLYNLIIFVEKKNAKIIYLFYCFLFINFSILAKIQVYFYFPWFLLMVLFFCKIELTNYNNNLYNKKFYFYTGTLLLIFVLVYPLINLRYTKLSILFLYYQLFFFNFIFFFYIKFYKNLDSKIRIIYFIIKYNFILIVTYLGCFIFFSSLPFLENTLIIKLTYLDPTSILQFSGNDSFHKGIDQFNVERLFSILNTINSNIFKIIKFYLFSLNFQSVLIYIILMLYFLTFKRQNFQTKISTPIIFLIFFLINFINSIRTNEVYYLYFIFSDFLLLILLTINLNYIKSNKILITSIFSFSIIFLVTFNLLNLNIVNYNYDNFNKKNELKYWCNQKYVENFAKKLTSKFYNYCEKL